MKASSVAARHGHAGTGNGPEKINDSAIHLAWDIPGTIAMPNTALDPAAHHRAYADLLDGLDIGCCIFDAGDRALVWNECFLRFFPEHRDGVHAGEPYAHNLRRFYAGRLAPQEMRFLERYVADGIAR